MIHEATILKDENKAGVVTTKNKHSRIDEVLKMVSEIKINKLILNHFSIRYSKDEILKTNHKLLKEYKIKIPVYLIYPGELS